MDFALKMMNFVRLQVAALSAQLKPVTARKLRAAIDSL